jgi:hypothetical protein
MLHQAKHDLSGLVEVETGLAYTSDIPFQFGLGLLSIVALGPDYFQTNSGENRDEINHHFSHPDILTLTLKK